ncbi:MAG: KpsF/GutQ family sugar-phosphate isomerase [Chromatiales bacterium]|jgi:arabinose-5-phosphate isomerase
MRLNDEELIRLGKETVHKQAEAVLNLEKQIDTSFAEAVKCIRRAEGHTIICGMGKSGHIGSKIAATLASTGTPAFFVHPAEAFHGDLGMITPDDIIVLISYSGETDEVNKLIPSLKSFGIPIICIVGDSGSTLARNSDIVLTMAVEREVCPNNLAPTNSTLTTLALGDAIAVALIEERQFNPGDFARFHPGGSLGRRLLTRVRDVMHTPPLPVVEPGTSMLDTIAVMNKGRLGTAIVAEEGRVLGIITDGDLRRAIAAGIDLQNTNCDTVMTTTPKTIDGNERFAEAEQVMLENKINSLVVVNEDGKLSGILQIYDIE